MTPPLSEEDRRYLAAEYVSRDECDAKNAKTQEAIAKMSTNLAVLESTTIGIKKWLTAIGTAIITATVGGLVTLVALAIKHLL